MFASDLSGSNFRGANLGGAFLAQAQLRGAIFTDANLANSDFSFSDDTHPEESISLGLTQRQLDEARCVDGEPPDLRNLFDAETHEPLVWRGRTLEANG